MKAIRLLLATLLAAGSFQAHAQYGGGCDYYGMCDEPQVYTGLWWNPQESGWGLNTTHQGNILFATLFTYAADGQPLWLVASSLVGIGENSYTGALYRTHGPPFNQVPWSPIGFDQVGTMTVAWDTADTAMVSYTFNGTPVTKRVQRQVFGSSVPTCVVVAGSRAAETNYQDLWWDPAESGWGINLVHQGTIIFATLFSYSEAGRDKWFVASNLARQADGSFTGDLYATTGPAFNASPWTSIGFAPVGSMTLRFSNGENGTLTYNVGAAGVTKTITRQVFGAFTSACR